MVLPATLSPDEVTQAMGTPTTQSPTASAPTASAPSSSLPATLSADEVKSLGGSIPTSFDTPPEPQPSVKDTLLGPTIGALKFGASQVLGTAKQLAQGFPKMVASTIAGPAAGELMPSGEKIPGIAQESAAIDKATPYTEPQTTNEKVGYYGTAAASALLPLPKIGVAATEGVSPTLMNKVARINPSDAQKFSRMSSGATPGEYLDARGIYGNAEEVVSTLYDRFTKSKATADAELEKLPGLYKNKAVETALGDIVDHAKATSADGATSPYLGTAENLLNKMRTEGLNMADINAAKRLYERTVKLNFINDGVSAGIERANNIDNSIRSWQQDTASKLGLKNLGEINKDTQLAKMLIDAIGKKQNAQIGNNMVGLTDWIIAGHVPSDPHSLALLLGKKLVDSKTVMGGVAKVLSRGEKIGEPGAVHAPYIPSDRLALPAPGETSQASNLPPVMHMRNTGLLPEDRFNPAGIKQPENNLPVPQSPVINDSTIPSANSASSQNILPSVAPTTPGASALPAAIGLPVAALPAAGKSLDPTADNPFPKIEDRLNQAPPSPLQYSRDGQPIDPLQYVRQNKPTSALPQKGPGKFVLGGVDIAKWATDPNHEKNVTRIYNSLPATSSPDDIHTYIQKIAPNSPIKGKDIWQAAQKHNVDPKLLIAILQQDSSLGTKGLGKKTNNPGNVGNDDAGNKRNFKTMRDGVFAAAALLAKMKVSQTAAAASALPAKK